MIVIVEGESQDRGKEVSRRKMEWKKIWDKEGNRKF